MCLPLDKCFTRLAWCVQFLHASCASACMQVLVAADGPRKRCGLLQKLIAYTKSFDFFNSMVFYNAPSDAQKNIQDLRFLIEYPRHAYANPISQNSVRKRWMWMCGFMHKLLNLLQNITKQMIRTRALSSLASMNRLIFCKTSSCENLNYICHELMIGIKLLEISKHLN